MQYRAVGKHNDHRNRRGDDTPLVPVALAGILLCDSPSKSNGSLGTIQRSDT